MYFQRCGHTIQVCEYAGYDPVRRRRKVRYLGSFSGPPIRLSSRLQAALDTPERQQKFKALLGDFLAREQTTLARQMGESILENLVCCNEQLQQAVQLGCFLSHEVVKAIQKEAETLHKNARKLGTQKQKSAGQLPLTALHLLAQETGRQQVQ